MSIEQIIELHGLSLLKGVVVTLQLALIVWCIGIFAGGILGICGARWPLIVGAPIKVAAVVLAAMPALVFLFWMHYPLQSMLKIVVNPFVTSALTLSIINTFMVADLCRSSIRNFPKEYLWAARVCGIPEVKTLCHIKFPIILRQILPGILITQVNMLHATLFASFISVDEIFRSAQRINSLIFRPVEIYSGLALLFVIVCVPLHLLSHYMRLKFTREPSVR